MKIRLTAAWRVSALLSVAALVALVLPAGSAAAGPNWSQAEEITAPFFSEFEAGHVTSAACRGEGDCVAVGYTGFLGQAKAFAISETGGVWKTPVRIDPPSDAATKPNAYLESVACSGATCYAVGGYTDESGHGQPMVIRETAGSWSESSKLPRPSGTVPSEYVSLEAIACPAGGSCMAIGKVCPRTTFEDCEHVPSSEPTSTFQIGETEGSWGVPTTIPVPSNTSWALACPSAGSCVMSGNPITAVSQSGASWGAATEVLPPESFFETGHGAPALGSLACQISGCYAVGTYLTGRPGHEDSQGLTTTETGGSWSTGKQSVPPPNASPIIPFVQLESVACPASGVCVTVGSFDDSKGDSHAMFLGGSFGEWEDGVEILSPANAVTVAEGNPTADLTASACPASGACIALGYYQDKGLKSQVMVTKETSLGELKAGKEEEQPKTEEKQAAPPTSLTTTHALGHLSELAPTISPLLLIGGTSVRCTGRFCAYALRCRFGRTGCSGTAVLEVPSGKASRARKSKAVLYGKASFSIAAGHKGRLTIKLSRDARRLLGKRGRLRARLVILVKHDGRTTRVTRSVTLSALARHRH